eukprot:918325_1
MDEPHHVTVRSSNIWDNFSHITCINLLERTDRYTRVKSRFNDVGLREEQVQFHRVRKSMFGSKYGCAQSHLDVVRSYFSGESIEYGIIFEDDVVFHKGWQNVLEDAIIFINSTNAAEWDIFFLGSFILFPVEKTLVLPNKVWNAKAALGHAYIISRQGMRKIIQGIDLDDFKSHHNGYCQDIVWNNICENTFCHTESNRIDQEWIDSDNLWNDVAFLPPEYRLWFQCKIIPEFRKTYVHLIKLTMLIPYNWRPYIAHNLHFQAKIKRRNEDTIESTLQSSIFVSVFGYFYLCLIVLRTLYVKYSHRNRLLLLFSLFVVVLCMLCVKRSQRIYK